MNDRSKTATPKKSKKRSETERIFIEVCRSIGYLILDTATAPTRLADIRSRAYKYRALAFARRERFALRNLKRRGLITVKRTRDTEAVSLTDKGIAHALITCVQFHSKLLPSEWSCLVVFDIPEQFRARRHALRQLLTKLGFTALQKSFWTSRYNAAMHLRYYVKIMKLEKWVRVYTATEKNRG